MSAAQGTGVSRTHRIVDATFSVGASSISGAAGGATLGMLLGGFGGGMIGAFAGFALNAVLSGRSAWREAGERAAG